jgi:hypothetical protein
MVAVPTFLPSLQAPDSTIANTGIVKLDENLGVRAARLIAEFGQDVETVPQQRLSGIGAAEGRCPISQRISSNANSTRTSARIAP